MKMMMMGAFLRRGLRLRIQPFTANSVRAISTKVSTSTSTSARSDFWLYVFPLATLGLGTWQLYRLDWKLKLIKQAENALNDDPVPITSLSQNGDEDQLKLFRKLTITGEFLPLEIHVGPRTKASLNTADTANKGGGIIGGGKTEMGYYVVSPFQIVEDGGEDGLIKKGDVILVNRGWVPREVKDDIVKRLPTKDSKIVSFETLVRHFTTPQGNHTIFGESSVSSLFTPKNDTKGNIWYSFNVEQMRDFVKEQTGVEVRDFVVEVVDTERNYKQNLKLLKRGSNQLDPDCFPLSKAPALQFKNDHLQYAMTWFGLTGLTVLFIRRYGRKRF